jgi:hypothetical protein
MTDEGSRVSDFLLTLIPGPDPGSCPKCGCWRRAGMTHRCNPSELPDRYPITDETWERIHPTESEES